jgi:nicotinate-nucleotide pyrophosphorylase (carboxylating)
MHHEPFTDRLIELALEEDLGATGDVTTRATVDPNARAEARVVAKEPLVVAGTAVFARVLRRVDPTLELEVLVEDGVRVEKGTRVITARGAATSLLVAERPALNFLMRLSGIATLTATMAAALVGHEGVRVVDTRKTTPGWRALEKAAVRAGGGGNHRMGLFDGVLIKDNHIEAAGGITAAVTRARANAHHLLAIEVECGTLADVDEALSLDVACLLLDNMGDEMLTEAVRRVRAYEAKGHRKVVVEASGNMSLARLPSVAACGVDLISMGALTHQARSVDLSMKIELLA